MRSKTFYFCIGILVAFASNAVDIPEDRMLPLWLNVAPLGGAEGDAYAAAVLTVMQDEPIDHMFFYAAHVGNWSLFDGMKPRPVYYTFRTFAELRHGERLEIPVSPVKGVYALAAKTVDGGLMLVAQLETKEVKIAVDLPTGFKADEVRLILDEKEPLPISGWRNEGGKLLLPTAVGSATYRVSLCVDARR